MTRFLTAIAIASTVVLWAGDTRAQAGNASSSTKEQILSQRDVQRLASEAKTPEDHSKLSDYYLKSAARRDQEAADYEALAKSYSAHTGEKKSAKRAGAAWTQGAQHCRSLAVFARKAAAEDRALAALHATEATASPAH